MKIQTLIGSLCIVGMTIFTFSCGGGEPKGDYPPVDSTRIDSVETLKTVITPSGDTTPNKSQPDVRNSEKKVFVELTISGQVGDYTYVDLGLPSGTKWATYNVGATQPTEYGDYFAWGETKPKKNYEWSTYKYEEESYKSLNDGDDAWAGCNKYTIADGENQNADSVAWYDSNGNFIGDSLTTLLAEDDAATANWGEGWRMPTYPELRDMYEGCDWEWTKDFNGSGVAGRVGTSKINGNTIFLPAAGSRYGTDLDNVGYYGYYWSSSLGEDDSYDSYSLDFYSVCVDRFYGSRISGRSVRAVVREE